MIKVICKNFISQPKEIVAALQNKDLTVYEELKKWSIAGCFHAENAPQLDFWMVTTRNKLGVGREGEARENILKIGIGKVCFTCRGWTLPENLSVS